MLFSKSTVIASVLVVATAGLVSSTPAPVAFVGTTPRSIQQAEIVLRESTHGNGLEIAGPASYNHKINAASSSIGLQPVVTSAAVSVRVTSFPLIIGVAAIGGFLARSL